MSADKILNSKFDRKNFLKGAMASLGAMFLPMGAAKFSAEEVDSDILLPSPIKSVIFIMMTGGMSHVDTFDPKNGQTQFGTTTGASGIVLTDALSRTAREMNRGTLIRSTWSEDGDHGMAQFLVQTGYRQPQANGFPDIPSMGAVISHLKGKKNQQSYFPSHVTMGERGGMIGVGGFLGARNSGFHISNLDSAVSYLKPVWGNFPAERLVRRGQMLDMLNEKFRKRYASPSLDLWQQMSDAALEFVNSSRLSAFDLKKESADQRAKFGDTWFGKACLMAKRLAAEEVPFIQITKGGWDTHDNNRGRITEYMKEVDPGLSALLGELGSSGLLKQTLVVLTSEFGRTPNVAARDGRDHWPSVWTTLIAGGKIPGGFVYGDSGEKGEKPAKDPAHWRGVAATIYKAAGIDPEAMLKNAMGRPLRLVAQGHNDPIKALVGN